MMAKEDNATWFKMFLRNKAVFDAVPDEAAGQAIKAALTYAETGEVPPLEPLANVVFCAVRPSIDDALREFEVIRERNRENGRKGGRPKKPKTTDWDIEKPKKPSCFFKNPENQKIEDRGQKIEDRRKKIEDRIESITGVIGGETKTADKPPTRRINLPRFVKPTIDEVDAYFAQQGNVQQSQRFFDYYEANGWKVGKNSMRDWKAAARNWLRNQSQYDKAARGAAAPEIQDNQISRVIQMIEENKI